MREEREEDSVQRERMAPYEATERKLERTEPGPVSRRRRSDELWLGEGGEEGRREEAEGERERGKEGEEGEWGADMEVADGE